MKKILLFLTLITTSIFADDLISYQAALITGDRVFIPDAQAVKGELDTINDRIDNLNQESSDIDPDQIILNSIGSSVVIHPLMGTEQGGPDGNDKFGVTVIEYVNDKWVTNNILVDNVPWKYVRGLRSDIDKVNNSYIMGAVQRISNLTGWGNAIPTGAGLDFLQVRKDGNSFKTNSISIDTVDWGTIRNLDNRLFDVEYVKEAGNEFLTGIIEEIPLVGLNADQSTRTGFIIKTINAVTNESNGFVSYVSTERTVWIDDVTWNFVNQLNHRVQNLDKLGVLGNTFITGAEVMYPNFGSSNVSGPYVKFDVATVEKVIDENTGAITYNVTTNNILIDIIKPSDLATIENRIERVHPTLREPFDKALSTYLYQTGYFIHKKSDNDLNNYEYKVLDSDKRISSDDKDGTIDKFVFFRIPNLDMREFSELTDPITLEFRECGKHIEDNRSYPFGLPNGSHVIKITGDTIEDLVITNN